MENRNDAPQRLQKYLASCGVASRRKAEELILEGRVTVNGQTVTELGTKVVPSDTVTLDGKPVTPEERKLYIAFYKPPFVMCTLSDPENRQTVRDYFKDLPERVYPVGRLDYESEGLLFMTNDGDFSQSIIHPKYEIKKEYQIIIAGDVTERGLRTLREGVLLEDGMTAPARVDKLRYERGRTHMNITIHEGRNRQVRRMLTAVGFEVIFLKRVRIGPIQLGTLGSGRYRMLSEEELLSLKKQK